MTITKPEDVASYYQQISIAENYITKRFTEPLNKIEHQQQIKIINQIIQQYQPKTILEFAPGPARLTTDLITSTTTTGTSIDASDEMLTIAKNRMHQHHPTKSWTFLKADILNSSLPHPQPANLLFTIRFLLHFHTDDRKKIYAQAHKHLTKDGILVFECMNKTIVKPLRLLLGSSRYIVYDKLYTKKEIIQELEENNFKIIKMYPILNHFYTQSILSRPFKLLNQHHHAETIISLFEKIPSTQPYEWIILAQKK